MALGACLGQPQPTESVDATLLLDLRGKQGDFLLARKQISFAESFPIDGLLAPCASRTALRPCTECRDVRTRDLRETLIRVRDAGVVILENTTLASAFGGASRHRTMAQALQHSQAALFARLSTAGATDDEPIRASARSGRADWSALKKLDQFE